MCVGACVSEFFEMIIPSSLCVPVSKTTLIAPGQQKPKPKRETTRGEKGKRRRGERQEQITRGRQREGV